MKSNAVEILETDRAFRVIKPQGDFILTDARYPAYVAAWATGKSLAGIGRAMRLSDGFPGNLGVIFRKEFTDLRDSTIKDFEDYTGLKVDSAREVHLENGSIIMFRHLEELNNIQNINLGWFWIEQAEELDIDDQFFTLFGRLRRKGVPHSGFITANTKGHNWIWKLWKFGELKNTVARMMRENPDLFKIAKSADQIVQLFEAQTQDNAHNLSPEFLASLEILRSEKPAAYRRFVLNSWDDVDTFDAVIPSDWVEAAMKRTDAKVGNVVLGVDVARFGDDSTVIFPICGRRALPYVKLSGNDTMQVAGKIIEISGQLNAREIYIDIIGIGAGVFDRLKEQGYPVFAVNVAEASKIIDPKTQKPKFKNLRSQVWWMARESVNTHSEMNLAPFSLPDDNDLRNELCTPTYGFNSSGQIEVESKEDMKDRLGRSPDIADAYCLAIYGILGVSQRPAMGMYGDGLTVLAPSTGGFGRARADWML